jgi:hypothetical protein
MGRQHLNIGGNLQLFNPRVSKATIFKNRSIRAKKLRHPSALGKAQFRDSPQNRRRKLCYSTFRETFVPDRFQSRRIFKRHISQIRALLKTRFAQHRDPSGDLNFCQARVQETGLSDLGERTPILKNDLLEGRAMRKARMMKHFNTPRHAQRFQSALNESALHECPHARTVLENNRVAEHACETEHRNILQRSRQINLPENRLLKAGSAQAQKPGTPGEKVKPRAKSEAILSNNR